MLSDRFPDPRPWHEEEEPPTLEAERHRLTRALRDARDEYALAVELQADPRLSDRERARARRQARHWGRRIGSLKRKLERLEGAT